MAYNAKQHGRETCCVCICWSLILSPENEGCEEKACNRIGVLKQVWNLASGNSWLYLITFDDVLSGIARKETGRAGATNTRHYYIVSTESPCFGLMVGRVITSCWFVLLFSASSSWISVLSSVWRGVPYGTCNIVWMNSRVYPRVLVGFCLPGTRAWMLCGRELIEEAPIPAHQCSFVWNFFRYKLNMKLSIASIGRTV